MAASLGAHEVMELHEVLTDAIDGINQFELYRPHVKDPELASILDNQIRFMVQEYNQMVGSLQQKGAANITSYRFPRTAQPVYGLHQPQPQSPNTSFQQLEDRDVASGMLGCLKASATLKMIAALECADPHFRQMVQRGANNCADMAYEVWQYMNRKGYYQVPTMTQQTTQTMMQSYAPVNMGAEQNVGFSPTMGGMQNMNFAQQMGVGSPYMEQQDYLAKF